jgi:hypothetical protein
LAPLSAFHRRLADLLEEARASYVFLHLDPHGQTTDSDIDLAVDREGFRVVDMLLRTDAAGRLVQAFHYDVPWCWGYVLEQPSGRHQLVDLVCDPWGISFYGLATGPALRSARIVDGIRQPTPAATVLYLVVKRALKGDRAEDRRRLVEAFQEDPDGSTMILETHLSEAGRRMAKSLGGSDPEISASLRGVHAELIARRRRLRQTIARTAFGVLRVSRRLARPTGVVVCVTGPDGVGKSTVTQELTVVPQQVFKNTVGIHASPGLLPSPRRLLGRATRETSNPHSQTPSGPAGSLLRIAYLWFDNVLGWWPKVYWPRATRSLVVVERGWLDMVVDPQRYRLSSAAGAVRVLGRFLPKPDLVVQLTGCPELIFSRKPELSEDEIRRQLHAWETVEAQEPSTEFVRVGVDRQPEQVAADVMQHAIELTARRQNKLLSPLAVELLGGLSQGGQPYRAVVRGSRFRWLLPVNRSVRGSWHDGLYRPATRAHVAGSVGFELVRRSSRGHLGRATSFAVEKGLKPELEAALDVGGLDLSVAVTRDEGRRDRATLAARRRGQLVAYVKVDSGEAALNREREVLDVLERVELRSFRVPEVLAFFSWRGNAVLALAPMKIGGLADRSFGKSESQALVEIASLGRDLAGVLGEGRGLVPQHGDFTPWNSARSASDLALWDWESARLGLPLEDFFHWEVQRLVLFGRGSARGVIEAALEPSGLATRLCRELEISPDAAISALQSYLEWSISGVESPPHDSRETSVRREILDLLETVT